MIGQQRVELLLVRFQQAGLGRPGVLARWLLHPQGFLDRFGTTTQPPGNRPVAQLFDFRQAADLRPQGYVHPSLLAAADCSSSASVRISSRSAAGPPRSTRGRGSDKTWVNGAWYATKS